MGPLSTNVSTSTMCPAQQCAVHGRPCEFVRYPGEQPVNEGVATAGALTGPGTETGHKPDHKDSARLTREPGRFDIRGPEWYSPHLRGQSERSVSEVCTVNRSLAFWVGFGLVTVAALLLVAKAR